MLLGELEDLRGTVEGQVCVPIIISSLECGLRRDSKVVCGAQYFGYLDILRAMSAPLFTLLVDA